MRDPCTCSEPGVLCYACKNYQAELQALYAHNIALRREAAILARMALKPKQRETRPMITCICGTDFLLSRKQVYHLRQGGLCFCSTACRGKYRRGA